MSEKIFENLDELSRKLMERGHRSQAVLLHDAIEHGKKFEQESRWYSKRRK